MKYLTSIALLLCCLSPPHSAAQTRDTVDSVSSEAEYFRVLMPHQPKEVSLTTLKTNYGDLDLKGKSYEASSEGATYKIWALANEGDSETRPRQPVGVRDSSRGLSVAIPPDQKAIYILTLKGPQNWLARLQGANP